jgi:hypothetical protein
LANRYAGDGSSSWFDQNGPITMGPMQTQGMPYEAGGIAGTGNTVAPPNTAGFPPLQAPGSTWGGNQPGAVTWQTPSGTATSAVGGPDQFGGNYEQWFRALVGNRPWNQQTLNALMPTLQHYGINLTPPNASGDQTKIQLPNGQWVRVGFGEGHPVWVVQPGQGGSSGGAGAGSYSGPGAILPPFQAPSFADLQQEPGFQARIAMGQQGLQRSAAAQGSLLSGAFQKAFDRYNQDFATNEYGATYDRAMRTYQQNFLTQSQDPWSRYRDLYLGGLSAINTSKTPTTPLSS